MAPLRRLCRRSTPIALVALSVFSLASCGPRDGHFGSAGARINFTSNGERIYFTGTSNSGEQIYASGGTEMMNRHRQMHGGGCAVCHGAEREGRRLWPQFWIKAPALTAKALFIDSHADHGHGHAGSYDEASLRLAIIAGVTPSGAVLDAAMPRWTMSPRDLDDLVAYLKQPVHSDR